MVVREIRVLTLNEGEDLTHQLFRLEKGWVLRFCLGPSLHAKCVRIFTNHPVSEKKTYVRKQYHEIHWLKESSSTADRHSLYAEVHILIAGSFNYYFTVDESDKEAKASGKGYFVVDPTLSFDDEDAEDLTLDCIQCQTVISKSLGPFTEWEGRLRVAKETGYNMIHFTPIQELGQSNSAYSIKDQLKFSSVYNYANMEFTYNDVEGLVNKIWREWNMFSMTDLVLNHTADNSDWLQQHPECAYNLMNSPHLKPAYLLDRILHHFNEEVSLGKWESRGIPKEVSNESHLQAIHHVLSTEVIPKYKMHEFYTISKEDQVKKFKKAIEENRYVSNSRDELVIKQDHEYRRNKSTIDLDTALRLFNTDRPGVFNRTERIHICCEDLGNKIEELNNQRTAEMNDHLQTAIKNFVANARYRFVEPSGPLHGTVTLKEPLMHDYFIQPDSFKGGVDQDESHMNTDDGRFVMASNGWVMGDDPLRNFAESDSNVYLRRELIAWGDSAKLRYGKGPEDCPYLWEHMKLYAEITARIFHGVRLDNCHSTPLHVAEYMLDAARKIRPDLYVIAELFTGGEHLDNIFINRLGINSLIREALSAHDAHELGRLVYRYGGQPVGAFIQPRVRPLVPTMAHALFMDQTHDNKAPIEIRSPYDLLASSALVAMASCASGSNRGYDEMVPHHIHVVKETRLYRTWTDREFPEPPFVNENFSIMKGKRMLNDLHHTLGSMKFTEVFVDQLRGDVVSVTRHNPQTHETVVLIARTAFQMPENLKETGYIRPVHVQGVVTEIMFEISVHHTEAYNYTKDENYINGLPDYYIKTQCDIDAKDSEMVKVSCAEKTTEVHFTNFPPGSVIVLRCELHSEARNAILHVRRSVGQFGYLMRSYSGRKIFDYTSDKSNFRDIVSQLDFSALNHVLYRCDEEEKADKNGFGTYHIPGHGSMNYCGLRGIISLLAKISPYNDLGHPLCNNLREGDWLPEYVYKRLLVKSKTEDLGLWFRDVFQHLKAVPRFLIPSYFATIVTGAYIVLRDAVFNLMSEFIQDGSQFIQTLALGSVQFCGYVANAKLPALHPHMGESKSGDETMWEALSLAAGFPHFSSGYMRNWGRDTFIALRGLLLLPGRFSEARNIILSYGGCLRHGLIPNLLNEGSGARYNCRDAVWWWLQAIQDYCRLNKDGHNILADKVSRLYPTDDSECQEPGECTQDLSEVMQEALQKHAEGLTFRERNAGHSIDSHMTDAGFNVEIGVNWENGFVFGGNEWNCGTWMDKMGSSEKAGNRGKPATPRCGTAVEIVGLCKSALRWLSDMNKSKRYPYSGVKATINGKETHITFEEWGHKIQKNFEKQFWINSMPDEENESNPEMINRRGMYKDSYYSKPFWADFQFRPNFTVAMVVAPELFTPENAWTCLLNADEVLAGPLGMKTLDPKDWAYAGDYDNANDGTDERTAHGFNYHNGPEWVWPMGYFLRAQLYFAQKLESRMPGTVKATMGFVKTKLTNHFEEVMNSSWQSLPELTNSDGKYCKDSCRAQAWSVACILEVLYDLENISEQDDLTLEDVTPPKDSKIVTV